MPYREQDMNYCVFHKGEYKQCPLSLSLKGRKLAKADTEASNLAELDFYKIIEVCIRICDCIFLEQVITGECVFCDQPRNTESRSVWGCAGGRCQCWRGLSGLVMTAQPEDEHRTF